MRLDPFSYCRRHALGLVPFVAECCTLDLHDTVTATAVQQHLLSSAVVVCIHMHMCPGLFCLAW
jgi:hypothetical protein